MLHLLVSWILHSDEQYIFYLDTGVFFKQKKGQSGGGVEERKKSVSIMHASLIHFDTVLNEGDRYLSLLISNCTFFLM